MRKVHLISVSEPLMVDLALAIREKGYEVTVSGVGLSESLLEELRDSKCKCYGEGWYPEKLTKDINFVVLGAQVKKDNPELLRARELGLLIQSVPEFVYQRTKEKTRVVVAGSKGKKSIITMVAYALAKQNLLFDFALSAGCPVLSNLFKMSYEARIALIEGDALMTSDLEKRFQLEFYRPHIAVVSNMDPGSYAIYDSFIQSIEREGKLIYFSGDEKLKELALKVREDITAMPYEEHQVTDKEGTHYLVTRYGEYPVYVPDCYFLLNLNAARLVCKQLGVQDKDFYQAISEYSLTLRS
ncbi:MAG: UDP-N-acetylmuramate--alanine ligase [Tannerellaceae bacterium]|nr:UDP-N-acetylmuramate--alanine ligase [Tannerellaceae bacterium]